MTTQSIRVAVCDHEPRGVRRLRAAATGYDCRVVGTATTVGALEPLLGDRALDVEVVVLGPGVSHQPAASDIKRQRPRTKVVAVAQPDDSIDVDAWAADLDEVGAAILMTFLY